MDTMPPDYNIRTEAGGTVAYDARGNAHLGREQYWVYGAANPVTVYFAHDGRYPGGRNTFFYKHFLLPSKSGKTFQEKMQNRLVHRQLSDGAKRTATARGMTWRDKYGGDQPAENTVLDLGQLAPSLVMAAFAAAFTSAGAWGNNKVKNISVDFALPCIRNTVGAGGPHNGWVVTTRKISATTYDVTHFHSL